MIGAIKWGWDLAYQFREGIVTTVAPLLISALAEKNRGRDSSTLIHLDLTNETFKNWITTTYGAENVEEAKNHPAWVHLKSQLYSDLSRKMILPTVAIACLYITSQNGSLISSLRNLVSHSADISRVALPVLDRMAAHPSLSRLLDLRVVVCAPVVAKLLLLSANYLKGSYSPEDYLTRSLEMVSGLTFSLYFLGVSTTIYHSVANSLYLLAIEHFCSPVSDLSSLTQFIPNQSARNMLKPFSEIKLMTALQWVPSTLSHFEWFKNPGYFWVSHVFNLICYFDYLPTNAFLWGLQATIASYQATSAPYDVALLQGLFTRIGNLTFAELEKNLPELLKEIDASQNEGKISATLANGLKTLIHEKNKSILKAQAEEVLKQDMAQIPVEYNKILVPLGDPKKPVVPENQYLELSALIKNQLKNFFDQQMTRLFTEAYNETGIEAKIREHLDALKSTCSAARDALKVEDFKALVARCSHLPEDRFDERLSLKLQLSAICRKNDEADAEKLRELLNTFYRHLYTAAGVKLNETSFIHSLSPAERRTVYEKYAEKIETFLLANEKPLTELFGIEGVLFALREIEDCFVFWEFYFNLFNSNFNWYLKNASGMPDEKRKSCEMKLSKLLQSALIDPKALIKTRAFASTLEAGSLQTSNEQILVNAAVQSIPKMKQFEYRSQSGVPIPADFHFATYTLPFMVGYLRSQASAPQNTVPLTNHLPEEYCSEFDRNTSIPELKDLYDLESKEIPEKIPSSAEIREIQEGAAPH